MQNIKDRELLAFCSLAKLKLEFSQYKNIEKDGKGNETTTYKTIHDLIKAEIDGQKNRKTLGITRKEKEIKIIEQEIINRGVVNKDYINNALIVESLNKEKNNKDNTAEEIIVEEIDGIPLKNLEEDDVKLKEKLNKKKEEYQTEVRSRIDNGENLGVFYRKYDNTDIEFTYSKSKELREIAPILMECYDKKKDNLEVVYLNEWEVVYAGDSYNITSTVIEDFIDQIIPEGKTKDEKEKNTKRKQELLKKIPTRDELEKLKEKQEKIEFTITAIEYILSVFEISISSTVNSSRRYSKSLLVRNAIKKGTNGYDEFVAPFLEILGIDSADGVAVKKLVEFCYDIIEKNGDITKISDTELLGKLTNKIGMKKILDYNDYETRVVLLRKKSTPSDYVIVTHDISETIIDKDMGSGKLPKQVFVMRELLEAFKSRFSNEGKFNAIFTGYGGGASLAVSLGILLGSDSEVRPYFIKKELEFLSGIPDLTEQDMFNIVNDNDFFYNWEAVIIGGKNSIDAIKELLIAKILLTTIRVVILSKNFSPHGLLSEIIKEGVIILSAIGVNFLYEQMERNEMKMILDILIKNKIIENKAENKKEKKQHYSKEKILGRVNKEIINEIETHKFPWQSEQLNLPSFIQMSYFTEIKEYKFKHAGYDESKNKIYEYKKTLNAVHEIFQIIEIKINSLSGEIKGIRLFQYFREMTRSGGVTNRYIKIPIDIKHEKLDEKGMIGENMRDILILFAKIQENYESINIQGYHVEIEKKEVNSTQVENVKLIKITELLSLENKE